LIEIWLVAYALRARVKMALSRPYSDSKLKQLASTVNALRRSVERMERGCGLASPMTQQSSQEISAASFRTELPNLHARLTEIERLRAAKSVLKL
jgi:hypothetical protein